MTPFSSVSIVDFEQVNVSWKVEAFKCLESSNKEVPSTKNLILKRNLNFEILNEVENIKKQKQKFDVSNLIWKGYKNT